MKHEPLFDLPRSAVPMWLGRYRWTHFVTLATHAPGLSDDAMRSRLRRWGAMMNRRLLGAQWQRKADEQLFGCWFIEGLDSGPHWHGLIILDEPDGQRWAMQDEALTTYGKAAWKRIQPSGTYDVRLVPWDAKDKIADYVAKELRHQVNYEHFIVLGERA